MHLKSTSMKACGISPRTQINSDNSGEHLKWKPVTNPSQRTRKLVKPMGYSPEKGAYHRAIHKPKPMNLRWRLIFWGFVLDAPLLAISFKAFIPQMHNYAALLNLRITLGGICSESTNQSTISLLSTNDHQKRSRRNLSANLWCRSISISRAFQRTPPWPHQKLKRRAAAPRSAKRIKSLQGISQIKNCA